MIIAGDGAGIRALYKGVLPFYSEVKVLTNTPDVLELRKEDLLINSFFEVDDPLIVCSAYAPFITKEELEQKKFLNIHYAPLPRFRGMHPIVWGIINDEDELGWTLHEMDQFMDSGPIIYQRLFENNRESSSIEYMNIFHESVAAEVGKALVQYESGELKSSPQDHALATWGAKRNLQDCKLDFSQSHYEIKCFFRALVKPYPIPFVERRGEKYFIEDFMLHSQNISKLTLGRICNIDSNGIWIKVRDGYLCAKSLCDENGNSIPTSNFRIGMRFEV